MKLLDNGSSLLCVLLTLVVAGCSYPTAVNITAEDFMNMQEIRVRSDGSLIDGSLIHNTNNIDMVCGGCTPSYSYKKVGDGDPHQNFVITQKGGTLVACDTSSSSTGTGYSVTLGWSLSIGVNTPFESAGFSISESESYSVSNTFSCSGVAAENGDICVMFYQAVTAFTVDVTEVNSCACGGTSTSDHGTATVYAPNADQIGSVAGRGINVIHNGVEQCVGDSDRTVNYYCGPPGGPEWWNGRGEGPWIDDYVNQREPAGCGIPIEAYRFSD